jgi:fumarylacetoacetate (FAA) hydrolase
MKLGSLNRGRDGALIVISKDGTRYSEVENISPTMQQALENWSDVESKLQKVYTQLNENMNFGHSLDTTELHSPLPRAYEWIDGSAYINHIVLVRKARNAEPPETLRTDPLVYQGGSSVFLRPTEDIPLKNEQWGLDFESEICVVLDDIPMGTTGADVDKHVRLVMLCNDVTLRSLIPLELKKGFGFFNSKPATAFSPFAVTPDELGDNWIEGRLHINMKTWLNGDLFGDVESGPEMHFSFRDIVGHICKTRSFCAGTIVGSGTVSNEDTSKGSSCLSEKRMLETIADGHPTTSYMTDGDHVQIEMVNNDGESIFGQINQTVRQV